MAYRYLIKTWLVGHKVQFKSDLFIHKNFRFLAVVLTQEESFSFCWTAFSHLQRLEFYYERAHS